MSITCRVTPHRGSGGMMFPARRRAGFPPSAARCGARRSGMIVPLFCATAVVSYRTLPVLTLTIFLTALFFVHGALAVAATTQSEDRFHCRCFPDLGRGSALSWAGAIGTVGMGGRGVELAGVGPSQRPRRRRPRRSRLRAAERAKDRESRAIEAASLDRSHGVTPWIGGAIDVWTTVFLGRPSSVPRDLIRGGSRSEDPAASSHHAPVDVRRCPLSRMESPPMGGLARLSRVRTLVRVMRFGILGPPQVTDLEGREVALGGASSAQCWRSLLLHAGPVVSNER